MKNSTHPASPIAGSLDRLANAPAPLHPLLDPHAYPLHDKDGFIEFATAMWLHTRAIAGPPTIEEIRETLREFPRARQDDVIRWLMRYGQVPVFNLAVITEFMVSAAAVNWAERIVA
jgi:hypothetical protein